MEINISVNGIEGVLTKIQGIPRGIKPALQAVTQFIVGVLKQYEPYKYVSRAEAYGYTFKSDAQRRWFWANGGPAMIGNNRTGATAEAWSFADIPNGYRVSNPTAGAYYTRDDGGQALQPRLVGWKNVTEKISENWAQAIGIFISTMQQYLNAQ